MSEKSTCPSCGFVDILKEFDRCPVCEEQSEAVSPKCYFLRDESKCGVDATTCGFWESRDFDSCRKLCGLAN